MRSTYMLCCLLFLIVGLSETKAQTTVTLDSTVLTIDTLIYGMDIPWEIKWGPDNWIWSTERFGRVSRINPSTGAQDVILNISAGNGGPVYQNTESGLLGMDFHPDFVDSPYVYLVYTYRNTSSQTVERMARYTYSNDSLIDPVTFVEGIPAGTNHDGSRLIVSPDGHLFMSMGDHTDQSTPQNINSLNGKILRFNLDGSVPADNPIPGSYVWSWGHRNAQGLLFAPNGIFYSSEHGPTTDDEFNIIMKGRNYGWPTVAGFCNTGPEQTFCADSNVVEPLAAWTPTIAPSDIAWYDHPAIPEWRGTVLMSVLKDMKLVRLSLDSTGQQVTGQTIYFANRFGRLRDVLVAPDGRVFLATNGSDYSNTHPNTHCIVELRNAAYMPPLLVSAGNDIFLCPGDSSQLTTTTTGGTPPYTYQWTPSAGLSCDTCPNPNASPDSTTDYILTVTDSTGSVATDTATVSITDTSYLQPNIGFDLLYGVRGGAIYYLTDSTYQGQIDWDFGDSLDATPGSGDTVTHVYNQTYPDFYDPYVCVTIYDSCGFPHTMCRNFFLGWEGIDELTADDINLYPNPANDQLTITANNKTNAPVQVSLLNLLGQRLNNQELGNQSSQWQTQLGVGSYPAGVYVLQVTIGNQIVRKKILVQRN